MSGWEFEASAAEIGFAAVSSASKGKHAGGAWTHLAIVPLTTWSRMILMGSMANDGACSRLGRLDHLGLRSACGAR